MAKQSYLGANVVPGFDIWGGLIEKENQLIYDMATIVVTVTSNTTGALTSGNAFVNGYFSSNTLIAKDALRGGTVAASANLNITSNVVISPVTFSSSANSLFSNSSFFTGSLNANGGVVISSGIANISSNAFFSGSNTSFSGNNVNISSNTFFSGSNTSFSGNNVNISSNVSITSSNLRIFANSSVVVANAFSNSSTSYLTFSGTQTSLASFNNLIAGTNLIVSANAVITGTNLAISSNALFSGPNTAIVGTNLLISSNTLFSGSNTSANNLKVLTSTRLPNLANVSFTDQNSNNGYYLKISANTLVYAVPALSELSDANIAAPQNGQALVYNSSSGKWQPSSSITSITGDNIIANTVVGNQYIVGGYIGNISGGNGYVINAYCNSSISVLTTKANNFTHTIDGSNGNIIVYSANSSASIERVRIAGSDGLLSVNASIVSSSAIVAGSSLLVGTTVTAGNSGYFGVDANNSSLVFSGNMRHSANANLNFDYSFGGSGGGLNIRRGSSQTTTLFLAANGNIGIGNVTPQYLLQVAGDVNLTGNLYQNGIQFQSGVTAFNSRTGSVSLTSNDVTTALTFTPANRAGESFTGTISTTNSIVVGIDGTFNRNIIVSGNASVTGNISGNVISATSFSGNGALLTTTNASSLSTGTVAIARLPVANTTSAGITTLIDSVSNTSIVLVPTSNSVKTAYDAAISANTNAANASFLASGTIASGRLSGNYTGITAVGTLNNLLVSNYVSINSANATAGGYTTILDNGRSVRYGEYGSTSTYSYVLAGAGNPIYLWANNGIATAALYANGLFEASRVSGNGSLLTSLNASSLSSGTIANTRLPSVVGRVNTQGISRGTYGSISISNTSAGWAGIDFTDMTSTFLVGANGYSGMYYNDNTWIWAFNTSGILVNGVVPFSSVANTTISNPQFNSLGIGTAASGSAGDIRASGGITAYYSDKRLKTNISNIENALDKIQKINGVHYKTNEIAHSYGYKNENQVGVIAQEIKEILPEAVVLAPFDSDFTKDGEIYSISGENYLTVQYEKLIPLLIEAIKEQQTQIEYLKSKIEKL